MLPGGVETEPPADNRADVKIAAGPVSTEFPRDARYSSEYLIHGSSVILRIPRIGRFCIDSGRRITVDAQINANHADLIAYLKGSVLAILLHQRQAMPLHASCVARNGQAIAFLGNSATGKSTMAALFAGNGFRLICDDVLVHRDDDEGAIVLPSDNSTKLWRDSATALNLADGAVQEGPSNVKHARPTGAAGMAGVNRLRALFMLSWLFPLSADPEIRPVSEIQAFSQVRKNIYRDQLVAALDLEGQYMTRIAKLISAVPVFILARPPNFSAIDGITELVADRVGV